MPTEPFALNYEYLIHNTKNYLQSGIDVLKEIFNCDINFISSKNKTFSKLNNVNHYTFNTLHPAGNVGIQIHHIDPIKNANDTRWYLSLQDLNRIGQYFNADSSMKHKLRGSQYPATISILSRGSEHAVVELRDVPKIERPNILTACNSKASSSFALSNRFIFTNTKH